MGRLPALSYILCVAVALACALPATAQSLLPPFNGFALDEPPDPPPHGAPAHYGATAPQAAWVIAQWNIPGGKLSVFAPDGSGAFKADSTEAHVQVTPGAGTINFHQTGAVLPCSSSNGSPRESDLFFAPAGSRLVKLVPLEGLGGLQQQAVVTLQAAVLANAVCKVNLGYAVLAVTLVDRKVQPAQVFFYQLELSQLCQVPAGAPACPSAHSHMYYYGRKNPYGADDYLPLAGRPYLASGETARLSINLLPRLITALQDGPAGIDRDPSHWVVSSAYYGQHIWGKVELSTSWSDVKLTAR